MLSEFYNYIANNTLSFFQSKASSMQPGERYCLKLDNEAMVEGVDLALRNTTAVNHIQGVFDYGAVYSTFTIKLSANLEIVVASKINGMTDDFLATLRNAELTNNHFPILMITSSAIDTISSGTGDLSANGMPFHASSIISKIEDDILNAQLSVQDRTLLELELGRKQKDRFSDKSSLFEYADLLTVLGRGYVQQVDYPLFSLLPDPDAAHLLDAKKIRDRLQDNHKIFERIDRIIKHGNIADDLEKEFDRSFIDHLQNCKKRNYPWYENYTYAMVKSSQDKLKKKLDNPLQIDDSDFEVFSGSPIEYSFIPDDTFLMRDDGDSKLKSRRKNILVFNPDKKETVTISVHTNLYVKPAWLEANGCKATSAAKEVKIDIVPEGCTFAQTKITDLNNKITYTIKICIINVSARYLENIQTSYILSVPKYIKRATIQVFGIAKHLVINPGNEILLEAEAQDGAVYECNYNQTLDLSIGDESINSDTGHMDCGIKFGGVTIPIQIQDELVKPVEITGIGAFKWKYSEKKSLEYRNGKIISGTKEFYTKESLRNHLANENLFVKNKWCAIIEDSEGCKEYKLSIPEDLRVAYICFLNALDRKRTLPSLAYYDGEILTAARKYVDEVEKAFSSINPGDTLSNTQNNVLLLGCILKITDDRAIAMSPLHPLNVLYQIRLLEEQDVGSVRDNLIEKLTPLYLIPFIKDTEKNLYHAIEQKQTPEWRYYAPISNKRYQGARNFVQKLVCDKISQYREHFSFLFDDLGNKQMSINLVNMGDCREIFQGLLRFYVQSLKENVDPADSYFSREKMSILSAIKVCMAYYAHPDIVWIPISLEEMLRVSGGAGLSQKEGLLSAKNLGFEQRATSDDILLVGIEGPAEQIKLYVHPVEVKIGQNSQGVLNKAKSQVINTYKGLWNALWPEDGKETLERKMSRNFFMQLIIVCCEKLKLYGVYPDENWDDVLVTYRENLLNENYVFSDEMDKYIGKGTIAHLLQMQKDINENGPEEFANLELISLPELRTIRRIWVFDKHEFDDSLPTIYEEITGKKFSDPEWVGSEAFRKDEWDILKSVCDDLYPNEELIFEMMYSLVDVENQASSLNQRSNSANDIIVFC